MSSPVILLNAGSGVLPIRARPRRAVAFAQASTQGLTAPGGPFTVGSNPFWLACWARVLLTGSATASQAIMARDNGGSDRAWSLLYTSTGFNRYRFGLSLNGSTLTTVNADTYGNGVHDTWVYLFAYRSGATLAISVNGGAFDTTTIGTGSAFASTADFTIGRLGSGGIPMGGRVDQAAFGISPSASFADIRTALYCAGRGCRYEDIPDPSDWGLTAYWQFNEMRGTRFDSHGTNHLTAVNGPAAALGVA
jgi:hypothetical protein